MKAAVFHKPHDVRYENVPDAKIEKPTDAVIRVTATAICGSDLRIYNDFFPQLHSMVLGHEFRGGRISLLGIYATNYDHFPLGPWMDKGLQIWGGHAPVHNYMNELIQIVKVVMKP